MQNISVALQTICMQNVQSSSDTLIIFIHILKMFKPTQ